jgi:tetratricopeptide (TPR) repeat protein
MSHGDILGALGKSEEALVAYQGVLEVYDKADNPKRWAPVAYNVADGYINAGKCDRALPIVERIIAFANAGRITGNLGPTALGLRGKCSARAGKPAAALVDLDEAIAQCDRVGAKEFAADFRIEAGKVHAAAHNRAAATKRFREVLDVLPDDKDELHQQLRALASKLLTGG